jgi:hypothetical protein
VPLINVSPGPDTIRLDFDQQIGSPVAPELVFKSAAEVSWFDPQTNLVATYYNFVAIVKSAGANVRFTLNGRVRLETHPYVIRLMSIYHLSGCITYPNERIKHPVTGTSTQSSEW